MTQVVAQRYTGQPVKRSEDGRLLTGQGRFVADLELPGMAHATFVRSPFPHARIVSIDVSTAREAPGVVAVYSGPELEALVSPGAVGMGGMMGSTYVDHSVLATDKVRLVGDPVALVVAEDRYLAEDAAELVEVEYEELPPVANTEQALEPGAPLVFDELGTNVVATINEVFGDVDGAFAAADHVVEARLAQHRHQNVPMECRGSVSDFDAATGKLTVWSSSQGVHSVRVTVARKLGLDLENVRVRTEDVGGSFGLKISASREDVACAAASRQLGRPVKWIEDRFEHMATSGHAREETFDVTAAIDKDGVILGMKVGITVDTGAYPGMGHMVGRIIMGMIPGPYRMTGLQVDIRAVATNKATYVAYRGPWAGETFLRERMVDIIARKLGVEPLEIRLRNAVTRDGDPKMVTGRSLAGVTVRESLERVQQIIDIPAFHARQAAARAEGRYLGLGTAAYIEAAPGPDPGKASQGPGEQMRMELAEDGIVIVYTGQMPHGQSIQTTAAQIAADELGVPFESVRVVVGDTDVVPPGLTGGSRSATMAGGASLHNARALRARILDVAGHLLEASPDDLEITAGTVAVRGVPARGMTLPEIATAVREPGRLPEGVDPDLTVSNPYDGGRGGWSGGTHCVLVEVDVHTGLVTFERYVIVEDCGELINPAIVDGQIRGGVAQGIGAVLLERSTYDENAQFLASTFMDYLVPTSMDVPRLEIEHMETVPLDPDVNFRGVGEGGMIVTPAAVTSAIEDALAPFGIEIREQHLPAARIHELVRQATGR